MVFHNENGRLKFQFILAYTKNKKETMDLAHFYHVINSVTF